MKCLSSDEGFERRRNNGTTARGLVQIVGLRCGLSDNLCSARSTRVSKVMLSACLCGNAASWTHNGRVAMTASGKNSPPQEKRSVIAFHRKPVIQSDSKLPAAARALA